MEATTLGGRRLTRSMTMIRRSFSAMWLRRVRLHPMRRHQSLLPRPRLRRLSLIRRRRRLGHRHNAVLESNPTVYEEPPQQQPLIVTPLSSMPYIDPLTSLSDINSFQHEGDTVPVETPQPALVYFASQPTQEVWGNILSVANNGVCLSGSAAAGALGPLLGKMDIGESEDSYLFRVGLPGVAREDFTCDVAPDGQIFIKGITTTGEKIVYKNSMKFEMLSQNLCPPGHFSISFKLPGAVDSQHLTAHFGIDGVFEGLVKKRIPAN